MERDFFIFYFFTDRNLASDVRSDGLHHIPVLRSFWHLIFILFFGCFFVYF